MASKKKEVIPFSWEARRLKTTKSLPLIGQGWARGIDIATPKQRDSSCRDCALGGTVKTTCMPGYDIPGQSADGPRLLVVGQSPTHLDDMEGGINPSGIASQVVNEVTKHWKGPIRYTYAVSCASGREVPEEALEACRGYLSNEVLTYKPDRILALGDVATRALFGHRVNTLGVRRSWGHVLGIPTFTLFNPQIALYNRFAKTWFRDDTQWAMTVKVKPLSEGEVFVPSTAQEVKDFLDILKPGELSIVDCEWAGGKEGIWKPEFRLLCVGICQDRRSMVVPGDVAEEAKEILTQWFEDPAYPKGGHNFKIDRHAIWRSLAANVANATVDTLLWARAIASDAPAGLKALAWNVGCGGYAGDAKEEAEDEEGKKDYSLIDPDTLHVYNARDLVVTAAVKKHLEPHMTRYQTTWDTLLAPAQDALVQVERWGIKLSEDNVRTYDRWLEERISRIDQALAGHGIPSTFNPRSGKQVSDLLFTKLGVKPDPKKVSKKTGAYSLDREALEAYKDQHPIIPILLERGYFAKQKASFALGLLEHIGYDGRVHPTYRVVRSSRLGCAAPNLQQSPGPSIKPGEPGWEEKRHTDLGVWARGCWVAEDGHKLIAVDFKQMELRVAAMLSGDEAMAAAFESNYDFHTMTGAAAFGIDPSQVDAGQRREAKQINFSLVFGMDAAGLAAQQGWPRSKAEKLLGSLLGKYKKFASWQKQQISQAQLAGESFVRWNPSPGLDWSHRRDLWKMGETGRDKEADKAIRHARNTALNNGIQSIANLFCLASLVEVVKWITTNNIPAKVVITVHDSLVLEAREDVYLEVAAKVAEIMTSWDSGLVKLGVDVEVGENWGTLHKLKL